MRPAHPIYPIAYFTEVIEIKKLLSTFYFIQIIASLYEGPFSFQQRIEKA